MVDPELIVISPASDDDYEFSFQVKKAAEGELIRSMFGWDEPLQRRLHLREWSAKRPSVIEYDGKHVGTVAVTRGDGYLEVGQFFILPEYQNKGIGSSVLRRILETADEDGLVSRLKFLKGNRAESLYRRHGFALVAEDETFCRMERQPPFGTRRATNAV